AGAAPLRRRELRWALLGAAIAASLLIGVAVGPWRTTDRASVAVLPFLDLSPAGDRAYLSDGLTEELLNALAKIPGLRVAARSSSFQFRDPGTDVRMVGQRLGVAAVVEGSVRLEGTRLRVTAQLIETRRGYHLWSEQYDRDLEDIFAVQEEIARTVASALSAELVSGLPDILVARATESTEAYDLYLRGRHDWNSRTTEGMWRALRAFERAIAIDPGYAAAYAGLSDTWQLLPDYGDVPARQGLAQAKTAALRAIALDSSLAEAHASLAALLDDYDRDRAGAEHEYRQAILLNPGYATARQWLAIHLADDGRFDEAIAEIERARRLDPLSRIINTAVGAVRYFARDYPGSVAEYRAVLDQAPDFALAWALMGRVFLVEGRVDTALSALKHAVNLSDGDPSYRAVYAAALAAAGRRDEGSALARDLKDVPPGGYVPYCELASAFLYLGDDAAALDLFERGFEERDPAIKHIGVEPLYDRIREHPRFHALLQGAGLR
ncbi:MAG TPA: tetratricopeptide repeat protein, partial [Gemmatimonadales bacterium]